MKKRGRVPKTGRKTTNRSIFEDPQKLKGRVVGMMRADFKKSPMHSAAKARAFKGKTVYGCEEKGCDFVVYTGASQKNFDKLKEELYPTLIRGKESKTMQMDHQNPVVPYTTSTKEMTLDEIAERIYCHEDNLQYICKDCHKAKTSAEATLRKEYRAKKKEKK